MEPVYQIDTINQLLKTMADHLEMKEPVIKEEKGEYTVTSGDRCLRVNASVGLITFINKGYNQSYLADTPGSLAGAMQAFKEHVDSQ